MGTLLQIRPTLRFKRGEVFEVPDEYNGHQRGTFYFRDESYGALHGPFLTFDEAEYELHLTTAGDNRA
jgi:hypothetical protein